MRWRTVWIAVAAAGAAASLVLIAAGSGAAATALITGIFAVVTLALMLGTDVMFGRHERSEKWDEFLHQPENVATDNPSPPTTPVDR